MLYWPKALRQFGFHKVMFASLVVYGVAKMVRILALPGYLGMSRLEANDFLCYC